MNFRILVTSTINVDFNSGSEESDEIQDEENYSSTEVNRF